MPRLSSGSGLGSDSGGDSDRDSGRDLGTKSSPKVPPQTAERRRGIYAFDRGWQFPAITEQHAYHRIREIGGAAPGTAYVAYPWATLIDKLDVQAPDAQAHLDSFRVFCLGLPKARIKLTVCQHIKLPAFRYLFGEAGVSHVFWAHTTRADLAAAGRNADGGITGAEAGMAAEVLTDVAAGAEPDLRLHPFPLYPVQVPQFDPDRLARTDRRWLFSFVGMRPNAWYLTHVRAWIIDLLGADPRGHVIARDDWHYKKIVYRHQVLNRAPKDADGRPEPGLVDAAASAQFCDVLYDSTFALCPSGTGPNSIRLWEAIMAGSIPVIIADTYAPPGDPRLWSEAVVVCAETPEAVAALPDRLAALACDPAAMAALRTGLARLRLLYGPHSFVPDVAALMQRIAAPPPSPTPLSERGAVRQLLARASAVLLGRSAPQDVAGPARAVLPAAHPVRRHYDRVAGEAAPPNAPSQASSGADLRTPQIGRGTPPALYLAGPGRTPLHHLALRRLVGAQIAFVSDPACADLIVAASLSDMQVAGPAHAARLILSEAAMPEVGVLPGSGPIWLGHASSDIFAFDRLPYGLVCDDHTLPRLAGLLGPERDLSPVALRDRWVAAPARAVVWRDGPEADGRCPVDQPVGAQLSLQGLAQTVAEVDPAVRLETGREGRADSADRGFAQIDKLARLDGLAPVIGAFETTCHSGHVGISAIEATALLARPATVLGPEHRLREILPEAALIDLFGLTPVAVAGRMLSAEADLVQAEAVCAARAALRDRLAQPGDVLAERQRIAAAILRVVFAHA